ncbi:MAG: GMC oxidoreductase, partial [Saprospiraceae bacterium]|nr:GMC oxidoreductase [Saprospiraceae bacterium]
KSKEYFARIIFVNASTLNSNLILLNSKSTRFPEGLGNDSGLLGKYIAFHNYRGSMLAGYEGFKNKYYKGRRPTMAIMPSFRNVHRQETDFLRGYLVAFEAARQGWSRPFTDAIGIGRDLKQEIARPGPWQVYMMMQGETIPKMDNHVRLSLDQTDPWGVPLLITSVRYDENDERMLEDFLMQGRLMLENAGCVDIKPADSKQSPGLDIHEMGGIRMGHHSNSSLLNRWNQLHSVKNVFVTDGACMTSVGTQNPSLTFMALTARAAHYAANQLRSQVL